MQHKPSIEQLKQALFDKGINLSHQRLKVLEYLLSHDGHPSADQIYRNLKDSMTTLSKTTVYNTLNLLEEAGVIRAVTIENDEVRYDIMTDFHGHFKCKICGQIYNFPVESNIEFHLPKNFKIDQKDLYLKGICPTCLPD